MNFKPNSTKFNFIFLGQNLFSPFILPLLSLTLLFILPRLLNVLVYFLILSFRLNLKFFLLLFLVFNTHVTSDRSLLTQMVLLLRFLSVLLFFSVMISATFYIITSLNPPSTLLLVFSIFLHAWFSIFLNFLMSLHLLLITGHLFTFALHSNLLSYRKSFTYIHYPIFLTSYYLNVLAYRLLRALISSESLPLIPTLKLFYFWLISLELSFSKSQISFSLCFFKKLKTHLFKQFVVERL